MLLLILRLAMTLGSGSILEVGHAPSTPCSHTWEHKHRHPYKQESIHMPQLLRSGLEHVPWLPSGLSEKSQAYWIKHIHFWHFTSITWKCIAVLDCEEDRELHSAWTTAIWIQGKHKVWWWLLQYQDPSSEMHDLSVQLLRALGQAALGCQPPSGTVSAVKSCFAQGHALLPGGLHLVTARVGVRRPDPHAITWYN